MFATGMSTLAVPSFCKAEASEFNINSQEKFLEVMTNESIYDNANIKIVLSNNIDLTDADLKPITEINRYFKGTFDGQGYAISNITYSSSTQYYGLFPLAENATIKNVKISGNNSFEFSPTNVLELYAGFLVGYGVNVTFDNCEFDANLSEGNGSEIEIPVYSNLNFGSLCGRLRNDASGGQITNCVNYYNFAFNLIKDVMLKVGGLVGSGDNATILNCLNYGNINFTNSLTSSQTGSVHIGGIEGTVNGTASKIRNACFGGSITPSLSTSGNFIGSIVGGALSDQPISANTNFVYYSDLNLKPSGDNFLALSDKIAQENNINREFLSNASNFDPASSSFDFDFVWRLTNSKIHLQRFQTFDFAFNSIIDNGQIVDSQSTCFQNDQELNSKNLTTKYGIPVKIVLNLKPEYYGYYELSKVLLNGNEPNDNLYVVEQQTNAEEQVTGYIISFTANAQTAGTYSFAVVAKGYDCVVTVSDSAKEGLEGGITIDDGTSLSFKDVLMTFYSSSKERKILAVGQGVYSFDYWELYVKDEENNFTKKVQFDNYQDSKLTIKFGAEPFNKEFKLVAYFTNEAAIKVDFGNYNKAIIKSIVFSGVTYEDSAILVSPTSTQNLEVTVDKNYKIDVDTFTRDIALLYGENPTTTLVVSEPIVNETGDKIYKFSINMRYLENVENNSVKLSFVTKEDETNSQKSLLWLYISLPIAIALIVVVLVIIVLRRRGGSHSTGGSKGTGTKAKEASYKDLYM